MPRRAALPRAGSPDHGAERTDARLGRYDSDGSITVALNGRRVRVEGGIPNETVRLAVSGRRDRPRAEIVSIIDPSPERVTPRCPVVAICGGCEWQHLSARGQLLHKAAIVRRLLAAQRLPTRIDAVHPMEPPWRYRIRAQIALGAESGFRLRHSKAIVGLRSCPVSHPVISRLLEDLNRLLRLRRLPDYRGRALLHAQVVGTPDMPGLQLLLEGVDGLRLGDDAATRDTADALMAVRGVASVAVRDGAGEIRQFAGPPLSPLRVLDRDLLLPPGSFFQSNWSLLPRLLHRALDLAGAGPGAVAADIYGGVGVFGLFLAERGADVTIVEIDPRAVVAARETARAWGLPPERLSFVAAAAEEAVPLLPRLDVAVVDPPRTGLDARTLAALIDGGAPRIVYVSCSPVSYARDAAQLVRAGYSIEAYELYDFYPQTVHVEGLALFVR